ncbi:MAG TPA: thioredoxin [Cytophagaceae bacterium]|jgi:thioredoxin 1|nr:thioredoxin [Cytophagaceae bacterium]
MEKAIEVTDANIDTILHTDQPVLLDFWAEWCPPCKMIGPMIDQLAMEYEGKALIGKVDVDNNPEVTIRYGVRSAPTLLVLLNGVVVEKQVGAVPKATLVQKLEPYIG